MSWCYVRGFMGNFVVYSECFLVPVWLVSKFSWGPGSDGLHFALFDSTTNTSTMSAFRQLCSSISKQRLQIPRRLVLQTSNRFYSISFNRPAPPPLPPKEQQEYEELIRSASTADVPNFTAADVSIKRSDDSLHPDARPPLKAEFEGDVNPVTGERGGPKQEPLRHGDWSFGGRATDFWWFNGGPIWRVILRGDALKVCNHFDVDCEVVMFRTFMQIWYQVNQHLRNEIFVFSPIV